MIRWPALAVTVLLVVPSHPPKRQWAAAAVPSAPAAGVGTAACSARVNLSDPLAVARSVTAWLFCGTGPPSAVSPHARALLPHRVGRSPVIVSETVFLDPRTAPVTVACQAAGHHVVLTLFSRSSGDWFVDDLAVVD